MNYSLCTISFRHQLISLLELVRFMKAKRFDGIEMWGIHAENMYEYDRASTEEQIRSMREDGMVVSMLSDYLSIDSEETFASTERKCDKLVSLAQWLGTRRIRTFAGNKASQVVSPQLRMEYTDRLRKLCERCASHGIQLVVETHPNTLADNLESTLTLLSDIGQDKLRLNFDVLHVWEFGGDLLQNLHILEPWIEHFHFKNIASPSQVTLFDPSNIYAAAGNREGMVPLHKGFIDYEKLLEQMMHMDCFASIEWFGPTPLHMLSEEIEWLHKQRYSIVQG
ncbi:sugar phosphate isomerase/epimerase [Paenibacillus sp. GSMTC-2017]|uniref:sugar phosphate isomerase/epimerase family protein n=1 Tax=Paenibacillus sp. GSMTC-2017 TaxID=2794350 RepID=UPI0018D5BEF2|nr:sugar phosphate isomerase/epimerase family protein [Paenibacillus sp. GSMTC-2017]MBH5319906.1 sugar phosphate isomerase/epimerase [Paenibacillus sp. GSMTC-2017]